MEHVREWHEYFKKTGEIPVPDDVENFDWIEDHHKFLVEWIICTISDKTLAKGHLKTLEEIMLGMDPEEYKDLPKLIDKEINKTEYAKNYRHKNKEEIKGRRAKYYSERKEKILCRKILDNLNKGLTEKPRPKTMERYEIQYDGAKWIGKY